MKLKTWHAVKNDLPPTFELIEKTTEGYYIVRDLITAQYELYGANQSTKGLWNCLRYGNTSLEFVRSLPEYNA